MKGRAHDDEYNTFMQNMKKQLGSEALGGDEI